jgi:hypothetical protein
MSKSSKKDSQILAEEQVCLQMTSDITCVILNNPKGFYTPILNTNDMCQCSKYYRYNGDKPFPLQYPCPVCGKCLEHYDIYFNEDGSTRNTQSIRKNIESDAVFLKNLYESYKGYHPFMCEYAQYLYSNGEYSEAIQVGFDLRERMIASMGIEGSMPLDIVGKSYRAQYKSCAKKGDYRKALIHIEGLKAIKRATKTDLTNAGKYESILTNSVLN